MTLHAGNTDYKITLTTALATTTAGSETPSTAHYVTFFAMNYEKSPLNLIKPKVSVAQAIYTPASKHDVSVVLKDCYVAPQGGNTALTEANALDDFFYQYNIKRGTSYLYLFIQHPAESDGYRMLDWNQSGTQIRPLKCAVEGFPSSAGPGKIITYSSIKFNTAA